MSAITKERIKLFIKDPLENGLTRGEQMELARIALASLEAEAIAVRARWKDEGSGHGDWRYYNIAHRDALMADETRECELIYTAPPVPVSVPDEIDKWQAIDDMRYHDESFRWDSSDGYEAGWNASSAAMLHGADGNSPVIPDDVSRMDWLVSKTVDVREPMVYGSRRLFWSQTITDEEDDYHATKLREQIDAAMAAENAAAPQQEVK